MPTTSDAELLGQYVRNRSETAFGEIVRRYANLVYSAARRQTDDVEQARDVVQMVFTDLARKAGSLGGASPLAGWLYRGVRLQIFELRRKDHRRQRRENEAMNLHDFSAQPAGDWSAVRPILDDAMASLGDKDRNALLLRFFKNESLAAVGGALGIGEDAAQKRVSRALDKLRALLARRGITTSEAALAATLAANAVELTPGGAEALWVAGALAGAPLGVSSFLPLFNMKMAFLVTALTGGLVFLSVLHSRSLHQVQELQTALRTQAKDLAATRAELTRLKGRFANGADDSRLREIARLRAKVDRLESDAKAAKARSPRPSAEPSPANAPAFPAQITLECKFLTLPASQFDAATPDVMTAAMAESIASKLTNNPEVNLAHTPRVTTLCGRATQLAMVDPVTIGRETTNVGLSLSISSECSTNSDAIGLQVSLLGTRLTAQSAIEALTADTSFTVPDGNTVAFHCEIPGEGPWFDGDPTNSPGPRVLLVFLAATLIDPAGNRLHVNDVSSAGDSPVVYPVPGGSATVYTSSTLTNSPAVLPAPSGTILQNPSGVFPEPNRILPASNP
ncbi:MAG: RNA polymerase sigma factor [Limisphaerales bacterium]